MSSHFTNRLDEKFAAAKQRNRAAIMPFLTMGYPQLELSLDLLETLSANGADVIEVGIPYSDPLADGPVIQAASQTALENGTTPDRVFALLEAYNANQPAATLVVMTYYNILLQQGLDAFVLRCKKAGVTGVVIPDLPLEESAPLKQRLDAHEIHLILFIPPNISDSRIAQIARQASGFIYLISVTGVTGARAQVPASLATLCEKIRQHTTTPIALGFGISSAEQVAQAAESVDGVIIGSALITAIGEADSALQGAAQFMQSVANYE